MTAKRIALLGATGSIGASTLDVVAAHPGRYRVVALAGGAQPARLAELAWRWRPEVVAVADPEAGPELTRLLDGSGVRGLSGAAGVAAVGAWESADLTVSAIVGAAGLAPTIAALRAGKDVALANKECLVMAGGLFMAEAARHGGRVLPVDSEHSAIFQVIGSGRGVRRLLLTASGGPFFGWTPERLAGVTPAQALAHPRWAMGPKISIDSATLMNKGLEVIEAHWLFGVPVAEIEVVVHPESIVHSLVDFVDGSVLAQLGAPDMRTPIAVALAWPERLATTVAPLDLVALARLTFHPPDEASFPCLGLARQAGARGGAAPALLNAANEVAVAAFLAGNLAFMEIPALIEWVLSTCDPAAPESIEGVLAIDQLAREAAGRWPQRPRPLR